MKTELFFSLMSGMLFMGTAYANLAIPFEEGNGLLEQEEVEIHIKGDLAEVSGTFSYQLSKLGSLWPDHDWPVLTLYLPVYAVEDASIDEIRPVITRGGEKLQVQVPDKRYGPGGMNEFGALPQLKGQKVFWFYVIFAGNQQKETLNISYKQRLAAGKFIYTPLIPKMKQGKDYGRINVSADRPMTLIDANEHKFNKAGEKTVIEPAHKRAIIVELGAR